MQLFYKDDDKAKYVKIVCPGNKTSQDSTGDPLNSTIGHREKQCTGTHTYTTTYRNKTVNVDNIKHIFIVLAPPTKSAFKNKKNAIYNI